MDRYVVYRISYKQAPCFGQRERHDYKPKHEGYYLNFQDIQDAIRDIFPDIIEGDWIVINYQNTDYVYRYEPLTGENAEYIANRLTLQGTTGGKICE